MSEDLLTEMGYAPVEMTHPRLFIIDEIREREIEPEAFSRALVEGGASLFNALGWCLYFCSGDNELRYGRDGAEDLARVLEGTTADFWERLEKQYFAEMELRNA